MKVLFKFKNILFFTELFIFGVAMGLIERLLFIFIVKDPSIGGLGGNASLCGYVVGVTVIFELPIF